MGETAFPQFDPTAFTSEFFAEYEQQMAETSVEDQASAVLADILTVRTADGTEKSYEQIRDETTVFFNNDWVKQDEALMNRMATEFAMACMGHDHGSELASDSQLGSTFERGIGNMGYKNADYKSGTDQGSYLEAAAKKRNRRKAEKDKRLREKAKRKREQEAKKAKDRSLSVSIIRKII